VPMSLPMSIKIERQSTLKPHFVEEWIETFLLFV
jgi:hypothetical protein